MKKFVFLSMAYFLIVISVISCRDKSHKPVRDIATKAQYSDPRMDTDMQRSESDSMTILNLSSQYLNLLKTNEVDSAINMLYTVQNGALRPLNDEERQSIRRVNMSFPVLNYKIDQMTIFSENDTEVRYTIEFFEKPEGDTRPNTISGVLSPKKVSGDWFLTIPNVMFEK